MYRWIVGPVVAALLLAFAVAPLSPSVATAASARAVNTWVTVKSTSPGAGCSVPVAVEVREAGNALAGVDVLGGLVVDGTVYNSGRGVTDAQGIGYLDIGTVDAPAGGNARIEINLAGTYVGQIPVSIIAGGSCTSGTQVLSAAVQIWWDAAAAQTAVAAAAPAAASQTSSEIRIPTYVQQRNLSCEYASLQIATGAWGNPISEYNFDSVVGWSANPHYGYRGDITGWWGNTTDYGVYAEPLAAALPQFGFSGETFYGQGSSAALTNRLDRGLPTLVWLGLWGDTGFYETGSDGSSYLLVPGAHVIVAYGYDEWGVYTSDPAIGATRFFDWASFMTAWNVFDGMGLAVAPL